MDAAPHAAAMPCCCACCAVSQSTATAGRQHGGSRCVSQLSGAWARPGWLMVGPLAVKATARAHHLSTLRSAAGFQMRKAVKPSVARHVASSCTRTAPTAAAAVMAAELWRTLPLLASLCTSVHGCCSMQLLLLLLACRALALGAPHSCRHLLPSPTGHISWGIQKLLCQQPAYCSRHGLLSSLLVSPHTPAGSSCSPQGAKKAPLEPTLQTPVNESHPRSLCVLCMSTALTETECGMGHT